jgi:response regulator of citrate/malate metabolism
MSGISTVVVDDDAQVAGIHTGFLLAHGGFEVAGVAHNGAEALAIIGEVRPELVLLDIHLPDMSGIDVLRAVRNLPGDPVDIIAITAARELDTVRAATAGGVLDYLVKPFNSQVLLQRLDKYVAHRGHVAEHAADAAAKLDQDRIDRLRGTVRIDDGAALVPPSPPHGRTVQAGPLPKGLSAHTLEAVAADLSGQEAGSSASASAERLGMARVSARRYLEFLVSMGNARVAPRYGAAGRPEKFYIWTDG